MRWQKKITKKELVHLREMGVTTLGQARRSAEHQAECRKQYPDIEPCWECKTINRKLGLPI